MSDAAESNHLPEDQRAFDESVARSFVRVPIPVGLSDRILQSLAVDAAEGAASPQRPRAVARRRWLSLAVGGVPATIAASALFAWWRRRAVRPLTADDLVDEVLAYHRRRADRLERTTSVVDRPPPPEYPLAGSIVPHGEIRWEPLDEALVGRTGAAYELASPRQARATAYVLAERGAFGAPPLEPLPTVPPDEPATTGGNACGIWREAACLVLFVVDGDRRRYRKFLRRPSDFA